MTDQQRSELREFRERVATVHDSLHEFDLHVLAKDDVIHQKWQALQLDLRMLLRQVNIVGITTLSVRGRSEPQATERRRISPSCLQLTTNNRKKTD